MKAKEDHSLKKSMKLEDQEVIDLSGRLLALLPPTSTTPSTTTVTSTTTSTTTTGSSPTTTTTAMTSSTTTTTTTTEVATIRQELKEVEIDEEMLLDSDHDLISLQLKSSGNNVNVVKQYFYYLAFIIFFLLTIK